MTGRSLASRAVEDFDRGTLPLSEAEEELLAEAQHNVEQNLQLFTWWMQIDANDSYTQRTEIRYDKPRDEGFLFFESPDIGGHRLRLMGSSQDLGCDRSTVQLPDLCEFVLGRFLRTSPFPPPSTVSEKPRRGFVYSQHYYKCRRDGVLGRFPERERSSIVDLRELGERYEWIVLEVELGELSFRPFVKRGPRFKIPLQNRQWIILVPELVVDQSIGDACYGFGYTLLRNPGHRGLLAHGPGQLDTGFQFFRFRMLDSGEVRTRLVFLTKRIEKIFDLNIGIDPALALMWLINILTFGWASRSFGISKRGFEEGMLLFHCRQHQEALEIVWWVWCRSRGELE